MNIVEINFELAQQLEKSLEKATRFKDDNEKSKIVTQYLDKYADEYSYNTIIHYIYWCTDFKIKILNQVLGYNSEDDLIYKGLIEIQAYEVKCNICKNSKWRDVNSWRELRKVKSNAKTYICHKCEIDVEACSKFYQEYSKTKELRKHEIGGAFYNNYLNSDHWREIRADAKVAAGYKCQLCLSNGKLNVHHKSYANINKESLDDLMVLCDECHRKHHSK